MRETTTLATNKYAAYFNAVLNNYATALLVDGQGSERHRQTAVAVDNLMAEYALATEVLDFVRGACLERIEHAKMNGGDFRATAEDEVRAYPMLEARIRDFVEVLADA